MAAPEIYQKKIDQILLGEASLQELASFFPNREAALNYYAQRMTEFFPPEKNTNTCECCSRNLTEVRAAFAWRGIYHTTETAIISSIGIAMAFALIHHTLHFFMPAKQINFSTTHGFCNSCFGQFRQQKKLSAIVKQTCLGLIVIAAIIFTAVIVFTLLFIIPQPTKTDIVFAVAGIFAGLLFLIVGLLVQD